MTPHNPLQRLHDLDRTSLQFHTQLVDFLRGNEYKDVVPGLRDEDSTWLIEFLDSVSLQTTPLRSAFNTRVGPPWYLRSRQYPISGITTRTQEDMRRQESAPEIVHAFGFSSGVCV